MLLFGFTEKWRSFIAFSIKVTVYGRLVLGLTHLSDTVVAISRNMDSNWAWRSFSDTWSSPFFNIYKRNIFTSISLWNFHYNEYWKGDVWILIRTCQSNESNNMHACTCKQISDWLSVPNTFFKSSFFATSPLETLTKIECVWRTSSMSVSLYRQNKKSGIMENPIQK